LNLKENRRAALSLAVCLSIAYLIPYRQFPLTAFYNDWLVIVGVVIGFSCYAEQKHTPFSMPLIALLPLLLASLIALQAALGMLGFAWDAILPVAYFLLAALAMVLGATLAAEPHGSVRLTNALALASLVPGLLSVAIASMQLVGAESQLGYWVMQMPHKVGEAIRPYGNTGQPNQLALLFCTAVAAVWWLYQSGRLRARLSVAAIVSLLWGLALTQSRIGWLIMPIFSCLVWHWRTRTEFKRISGFVICGLLLTYGALVYSLPAISSALGVESFSVAERAGSNSERWVLIQQALKISLVHPWFGVGWYEFGPQQLKIALGFTETVYSQHAHNIVRNFAAELGWPSTILILGSLAWWFVSASFGKVISKEVGFATLSLLAVLVHSLVEYPLWYAYVLLPMALLMGMVHQSQFGSVQVRVPRGIVLALFFLIGISLVMITTDYRRVVVSFRALGWETLGMKADEGTTVKPSITMFPQFYDYFQFTKTPARAGMSTEQISFMERVASRFGFPPVLMRMSLIYALNSRPDDAVRMMKTISLLHPGNYPEAYGAWREMAQREPDKYSEMFVQMDSPKKNLVREIAR